MLLFAMRKSPGRYRHLSLHHNPRGVDERPRHAHRRPCADSDSASPIEYRAYLSTQPGSRWVNGGRAGVGKTNALALAEMGRRNVRGW